MTVIDHWHNLPLILTEEEINVLSEKLSFEFGIQFSFVKRLNGGRSGADILRFTTNSDGDIVARVTSFTRAKRECFIMSKFSNAKTYLLLRENRTNLIKLPEIHRHFSVAVTLTKFVPGSALNINSGNEIHNQLCPRFSTLFESKSLNFSMDKHNELSRRFWGRFIENAHFFLGRDILKKHVINTFREQMQKPMDWIFAHGDPSVENVLRYRKDYIVIDYATGGIFPRLSQRARWVNSLALKDPISVEKCSICKNFANVEFILADLFRRLFSDFSSISRRSLVINRIISVDNHFSKLSVFFDQ
jgi:hypothetical protein